ncbi:hypothetical protein GF314_08050 [bacterium]|nr:hypothetical protein [bacterium]
MTCSRIREWISLEMDGQLEPRRVASLERHLEDCAECRSYREDLHLGQRLIAATEPQLPESFDWNLRLGLSRAMREAAQAAHPWPERRPGWQTWFSRAGVAAACGLAAVLTVAVLGPMDSLLPRGSGPAAVVIDDPTLRLPRSTGEPAVAVDASRRPLERRFLPVSGGFGGSLQRGVSNSSLLSESSTPRLDDAQVVRIRQLEQDVETLRRRLFAKDRQIQFLQARLDSVSTRGVDRH